MKVLVTGGTGAFGMAVCQQLARAGADPVAMARHEPRNLPRGVRFVGGDIRDASAVGRAVAGVDAVVHLAWFMGVNVPPAEQTATNIGGTTTLLDAMERAGCRRLVFTSSTTAYGTSEHHPDLFREDEPLNPSPTFLYAAQKEQIEELIAARDLDAVIARVTVVMGRNVDNGPSQAYSGPTLFDIGGRSVVQAVHQDDVGRFLERAALGDWRGTVNLAAPGAISMREAGRLLRRRVTNAPLRVAVGATEVLGKVGIDGIDGDVARALAFWPVADTTKLCEEWGFIPAWSQAEIMRDQERSASRATYLMPDGRRLDHPRRLPWAATIPPDPTVLRPDVAWRHAAPDGVRGEFDTPTDPAYPVYSATNLSEAFPGPMTPLSLDLSLHGMRAATEGLVQLFGMNDELGDLLRVGVAAFGHHVYVNVSSVRVMAEVMPGATVEDVDRMYLGIDAPAGEKSKMTAREALGAARLGARVAPRLAGYRREVDWLVEQAERVAAVDAALLDDSALLSHLALAHDLVCQAWSTSSAGNFFLAGLQDALGDGASGHGPSASGAALHGVESLARMDRDDPRFGAAFDDLVARCGHRGPGETELENEVYADRPEQLLGIIARAAAQFPARPAQPSMTGGQKRGVRSRLAHRILADKERARDAVVRCIHAVRVAVRERARRLADDGLLADPSDVFYLTWEELSSREPPAASVIAGRRAERARLAGYRLPLTFEGLWAPEIGGDDGATAGTVLRGIGAVPGRATGRARVLSSPSDELEAGEILVAATTDVGWTPYFALASAVVTDVGGVASHAAIVAREFGIPSVVGTGDATRRLRTGMRLEVDGAAGTVEVLD